MLNNQGITKTSGIAKSGILASTNVQYSVPVILSNTGVSADSEGRKILKAGTPISGDLTNRATAFALASTSATAVLLHDVDVTNGDANATALVLGVVDLSKVDASTEALLTAEIKKSLSHIIFVK